MAGRRAAWRGLAAFWLVVVIAGSVGLATLQVLGPLPRPAAPVRHESPPEAPAPQPVPPAGIARPDPALLERSRDTPPLLIPVVAPDGRAARAVYAAPSPPVPAGMRRVALLVGGFGLSDRDSRAALDALPGAASIAVSAYAGPNAAPLLEAARTAGHELLASLPMEPEGYPLNDEGTRSMMTGLPQEQNRRNMEWALAQVPGAVGATGASDGMRGERFAAISALFDPMVEEVARRGLLYLDARPGQPGRPGLPVRSVDVVLDDSPARAEIEARLAALERVARERGSAIGLVGQLRPVTLDRLAAWTRDLQARGLVLVPVSSLVEPPK